MNLKKTVNFLGRATMNKHHLPLDHAGFSICTVVNFFQAPPPPPHTQCILIHRPIEKLKMDQGTRLHTMHTNNMIIKLLYIYTSYMHTHTQYVHTHIVRHSLKVTCAHVLKLIA